jgi:hypothetical protein
VLDNRAANRPASVIAELDEDFGASPAERFVARRQTRTARPRPPDREDEQ